MNKVLTSKSPNSQNSLTLKESSKNEWCSTKPIISPLMISKRGILTKTNKPTKETETNDLVIQTNNQVPHREQMSIDFAAKQFFQILLMDIKSRHAQLNGKLEPVVSAFSV